MANSTPAPVRAAAAAAVRAAAAAVAADSRARVAAVVGTPHERNHTRRHASRAEDAAFNAAEDARVIGSAHGLDFAAVDRAITAAAEDSLSLGLAMAAASQADAFAKRSAETADRLARIRSLLSE